jgi:5'-nucleotidase
MLIYVDVDGVVVDLMSEWLKVYNKDYNDNVTPDMLNNGWDMPQYVKSECGSKIYEYLHHPYLYDYALPIERALYGVQKLREMGHRVVFATSTPQGVEGRKLQWLIDNHFIEPKDHVFKDYIEISDKSLLCGDILIDDGLHNVSGFKGLGILFDAPHTQKEDWPIRIKGWENVINYLESEKDKLPVGTHPTEIKSPIQAREFKDIVNEMYLVHLRKNFDYSPANILATGRLGLVTRLWDKVARFCNLTGYTVTVIDEKSIGEILFYTMSQVFWKSGMLIKLALNKTGIMKSPKNESIEDSLMDMAVYAIIGLLLRRDKWGK